MMPSLSPEMAMEQRPHRPVNLCRFLAPASPRLLKESTTYAERTVNEVTRGQTLGPPSDAFGLAVGCRQSSMRGGTLRGDITNHRSLQQNAVESALRCGHDREQAKACHRQSGNAFTA